MVRGSRSAPSGTSGAAGRQPGGMNRVPSPRPGSRIRTMLAMPGSILGTRVTRVEDRDLMTGRGCYVGDVAVEGLASLAFVRSPIAHGRVVGIDASAARSHPGVVAVLTAADLGIAPFHPFMVLNERCPRPPLADGKVRFVGEPLAAVVG